MYTKKGMDRSNKNIFLKYINALQQIPVPYGSLLHIPLTNLLLLAAKQVPYKKANLVMKNIEEFSGKSSGEWASWQKKKDKTESNRTTQKTTGKIVKRNQMTALRFQTGGRHQTSPASLWGDHDKLSASLDEFNLAKRGYKHEKMKRSFIF